MEVERFRELEKLLAPFGFELAQAHPFYLPESMPAVTPGDFEIVKYEGEQIEAFRGDKRFWEAFTFDSLAPDVLGVAAVKEGNILGMAGASADSPFFWQIGINVCPEAKREARGKHSRKNFEAGHSGAWHHAPITVPVCLISAPRESPTMPGLWQLGRSCMRIR